MKRSVCNPAHGFTMIELIVVIVLFSVLAGAIMPRLVSWQGRKPEQEAYAIGELLSTAAKRDALTSQRVALDFDAQRACFRIMSYQEQFDYAGRPIGAAWKDDILAGFVNLEETKVVSASADGAALDPGQFRVEFAPGASRPEVEIVLEDSEGVRGYIIALASGAWRARVLDRAAGVVTSDAGVIDLDATVGSEQPW